MNLYPIEIELTDFCGLKCKTCVNMSLGNKGFMTLEKFLYSIDYVYNNLGNIAYLDLAGIGDIFLHPKISIFLNLICKKFKNTGLNLLIPTKGQSINNTHIFLFKKIIRSGINLNISLGFYSLRRNIHNYLTGGENFDRMLILIKKLKKDNIPFSIELLQNKFSQNEKEYFKNFSSRIGGGSVIHTIHNFSGGIDSSYNSLVGEKKLSDLKIFSSWKKNSNYLIEGAFCAFVPFISYNGELYTCAISGKKKEFYIGEINDIFLKYKNILDLAIYIKKDILYKNLCFNCTIFHDYERKNINRGDNNKSM